MKATTGDRTKEGGSGSKAVEPARPRPGLMEFFGQVRHEVSKVTWPTTRETMVTTVAVFIMIGIAMVFFFLVDLVLSNLVKFVLNLV